MWVADDTPFLQTELVHVLSSYASLMLTCFSMQHQLDPNPFNLATQIYKYDFDVQKLRNEHIKTTKRLWRLNEVLLIDGPVLGLVDLM